MITLAESQIYRFETIEVDPSRGCVRRAGAETHLRQKTFQVLVYLLEQRGRLVPKEELMAAVWKNTAVTDDALVQSIKEIRRAFGDSSQNPKFIKTVPKAGYRFISPVKAFFNDSATTFIETEEITRVEVEYEEIENDAANRKTGDAENLSSRLQFIPTSPRPRVSVSPRLLLAAILTLISLSTIAFYFISSRSATSNVAVVLPQTPGKRTVAVMYFENQSGGAEIEWLREGLADMLITNLSRSGNLTVLSRGQLHLLLERSERAPRGKIDLEKALEIARKAHAATVVTGSFARLGEKMRLDVQLYDVASGALETAESLTVENPEQILTEIDLLSMKLVNRFGGSENETVLSEAMTDNLEAYRYYSLAVEKAQALHSKEAIALLEKAVALDPDFAMAHARIGYAYAVSWGWAEKGKPFLERAFALSERLTEKDRLQIAAWYAIANLDYQEAIGRFREIINRYPTETEACVRLGRLLAGEGRNEEAINVLKQGLLIDAEAKDVYNILGGLYSSLDRNREAIAMGERYVALAPQEANAYDSLGLFYQHAGDYAAAMENYRRALKIKPDFEIALIHLGNAQFQTGRYAAAIASYQKYIEIAPSENERSRGYACIAAVYLRKNDRAAAEKAAQKSLQNHKDSVWGLLAVALERGDAARAARYEERLFAKSTSNNRGARHNQRIEFYRRGFIALKNERSDEAVENFKEALRHPSPDWNIENFEDSLANAYLESNRPDEAVTEYERILRLNPNYPLARFHLAQAFEQKNQIAEARAAYAEFLQIWKDADADVPEIIAARKFLGL